VKLKDICTVFTDGDWIETKDQSAEGIRLVQTGNVKTGSFADRKDKARYISEETFGRLNCTEVKEGDILVSRLPEPVGRACVIPKLQEKLITAVDCTVIRTSKEVLPEYLNYFMQSPQYFSLVQDKVTGATRQRISRKNLGEVPVSYPPLAEQQRIVAKLDAAFAEIDRAVESSRCALRHADVLLVKVIETATSSAEHSQIVKVADVSDMQSGYGFKSGDYSDDATDVPLLRGDNIAPNYIDLSSAKRLPVKLAADYKRFELQTEDVILAMDRPYISTGLRLAKINESHMPCLLVQRVMRLRAEPKLNPDFLYLAMETPRFLDHILGSQTGLGVPHISGKTIGSFEFEMPSLEQQARIVSDVSAAKEQIKFLRLSHERRIDELINLRSALLTQELQPPHSEAA
jgi:type I restriction enzyme S subunit